MKVILKSLRACCLSPQRADQQGEGQRQRPHGASGQQERPELSHGGDETGAGAGAKLRGAVRRDFCQNQTGDAETVWTSAFRVLRFAWSTFDAFSVAGCGGSVLLSSARN